MLLSIPADCRRDLPSVYCSTCWYFVQRETCSVQVGTSNAGHKKLWLAAWVLVSNRVSCSASPDFTCSTLWRSIEMVLLSYPWVSALQRGPSSMRTAPQVPSRAHRMMSALAWRGRPGLISASGYDESGDFQTLAGAGVRSSVLCRPPPVGPRPDPAVGTCQSSTFVARACTRSQTVLHGETMHQAVARGIPAHPESSHTHLARSRAGGGVGGAIFPPSTAEHRPRPVSTHQKLSSTCA